MPLGLRNRRITEVAVSVIQDHRRTVLSACKAGLLGNMVDIARLGRRAEERVTLTAAEDHPLYLFRSCSCEKTAYRR